MRVILEKPITWLESDRDGCRNRLMYQTLLAAFREIGMTVQEVDVYYGNDFALRRAPDDGVLFSYHSVGDSKNVWRIKETPIPYFYNIDRLGYSGWSELSVDPAPHLNKIEELNISEAEKFRDGISNWLRTENLSKYAQNDNPPPLKSDFIFFPLQVRNDTVAAHNRLDPLKVLSAAAHAAREHKRALVIKRHPYCKSLRVKLHLLLLRQTNPYVAITDASVAAILPACDAVLVGNSGVGLEAIIHGKPVYSFANSEYDISSFKINSLDELTGIFIQRDYAQHQLSSRFVKYFLQERCFDARSISDTTKKINQVLGAASP